MIKQGVYRHYKGGLYTVLMAARCSDNGPNEGENVVVYVSHTTGNVCTRLAKDFYGMVGGVERFQFVAHSIGLPT
jgi:hypothetical protein